LAARLLPVLLALVACAGDGTPAPAADLDLVLAGAVVEASCGQCRLDLPGEGCDLAIRVDGATFFVRGTGIDDHGDSHAEDGFCNAVRSARVSGRVEDGVFVAETFELVD